MPDGKNGGLPNKVDDLFNKTKDNDAREDAAQDVYMGNKFLALRKSEIAKTAPDRAGIPSFYQIEKSGSR